MPLYEFCCSECDTEFEELVRLDESCPECPKCGSKNTFRIVSVPGPLAKGAFPFKVSPPRHGFGKAGSGCSHCKK